MAKRKKPGKKLLQQILSESAFNPDNQGPMKIIADLRDPAYYEMRAIELVSEARQLYNLPKLYHTKMTQAISLLALARAERSSDPVKTVTDSGIQNSAEDSPRACL